MFTPLIKALQDVMDYKLKYLRKRSIPYYKTNMTKFIDWLESTGRKDIHCGDFTENMAQDFMTHRLKNDNIGAVTFNNALTA